MFLLLFIQLSDERFHHQNDSSSNLTGYSPVKQATQCPTFERISFSSLSSLSTAAFVCPSSRLFCGLLLYAGVVVVVVDVVVLAVAVDVDEDEFCCCC